MNKFYKLRKHRLRNIELLASETAHLATIKPSCLLARLTRQHWTSWALGIASNAMMVNGCVFEVWWFRVTFVAYKPTNKAWFLGFWGVNICPEDEFWISWSVMNFNMVCIILKCYFLLISIINVFKDLFHHRWIVM